MKSRCDFRLYEKGKISVREGEGKTGSGETWLSKD